MQDIQNMNVEQFIEYRIHIVNEEIIDLILETERVVHSSNELSFITGRIAELNYERMALKKYLVEEIGY